jgi:hypothetical protein
MPIDSLALFKRPVLPQAQRKEVDANDPQMRQALEY